MSVRRLGASLLQAAAAPLALLVYLVIAILARLRRRSTKPRVVWGPTPIISIKYWSAALRQRGYESSTVVQAIMPINQRGDFDVAIEELRPKGMLRPLRPYVVFARVFARFDVFSCFFDGGFLSPTPLAPLEFPLLRLAGKAVVVSPYGSDIAVRGTLGPFEAGMAETYPALMRRGAKIRRRVDRLCRYANVVIRNLQPGYLPRYDVFWPTQVGIDTELWRPEGAAGRGEELVVVHASNHRPLKGTDALVAAVQELRGEGVPVRLELLERRPNADVHRAVLRADVVAEQFHAGYALAAIEGMSAGKPVLSNLSWLDDEARAAPGIVECPIVDTMPETIVAQLRGLARDPDLRASLGALGRTYVLRWHSYDAVGAVWESIISSAHRREPLAIAWPERS